VVVVLLLLLSGCGNCHKNILTHTYIHIHTQLMTLMYIRSAWQA